MPHIATLLGFALVSLGMVLTPGPNMIYLISRSISQGSAAGLVSLVKVSVDPVGRKRWEWNVTRSAQTARIG